MKRIVFNGLVESVRGSLTGVQNLQYARDYNKAWYSPEGGKNTARNYHANYIAKVSARTGDTYLVIRKRSSVKMSQDMVWQMAAQGAAAVIYNAAKNSNQYANMVTLYEHDKSIGAIPSDWSFRKYWWQPIFAMVRQGQLRYTARYGNVTVTIDNHWRLHIGALLFQVNNILLTKFWVPLAGMYARYYTINDRGVKIKMLSTGEDYFHEILDGNYNVLGLTSDGDHIMYGGLYLTYMYEGAPRTILDSFRPQENMFLSDTIYD